MDNLFQLPARNINLPTPSSSSTQSIKQRFDDRAYASLNSPGKPRVIQHAQSGKLISEDSLRWEQVAKTGTEVSSLIQSHGDVLLFAVTSGVTALAMSSGSIIGVNSAATSGAEVVFILDTPEGGSITSLGFSADGEFLAAGFSSGHILLFNVTTSSHYFTIQPTTLLDRTAQNKEGHIAGVPIVHLCFFGILHSQLLSSDMDGLVFYHYGLRRFLQTYFVSQKVLGKNMTNSEEYKRFLVHGMDVLPFGGTSLVTDDLGVVGVITEGVVMIVSVLSLNGGKKMKVIEHYKAGRPVTRPTGQTKSNLLPISKKPDMKSDLKKSDTSESPPSGTSVFSLPKLVLPLTPTSSNEVPDEPDHLPVSLPGRSLNWYPTTSTSTPRLVYTFDSTLTILELTAPELTLPVLSELKDKDKAVPDLGVKKTARWTSAQPILTCKWLSPHLLTVHHKSSLTVLYYSGSLLVVGHFPSPEAMENNLIKKVSKDYYHLFNIETCRNQIFLLSKDGLPNAEVITGRFLNWADNLGILLATGNYSAALNLAQRLYASPDRGTRVLVGLPFGTSNKNTLLRPYLLQIMRQSVALFDSDAFTVERLLKLYLDIIYENLFDAENVAELLTLLLDNCAPELFFSALTPYLSDNAHLPPDVLKALVGYYVSAGKGDQLTEVLCLLDMSVLDIDMTVGLCRKYALGDCLVYVWTKGLGDYGGVLHEFLGEITALWDDLESLRLTDTPADITPTGIHDMYSSDITFGTSGYTYISYILTGRQYPTEAYIPNELGAKKAIAAILFSSTSTHTTHTLFPNLFILLKHNSFLTLSALNEFFEDPILNEENNELGLNRQYITEALCDIFELDRTLLTEDDHVQLCIFIGRNYPKYPQFIRLSESTTSSVVTTLVQSTTSHDDCELALQSLLPSVDVDEELMLALKGGKYYAVLMNIYASEGRYAQVMDVWLKSLHDSETAELQNILEKAFTHTKNPIEIHTLWRVIRENFAQLVKIDINGVHRLIDMYAKGLHGEVLLLTSEKDVLCYLRLMFDNATSMQSKFLCRYIQLLLREEVYGVITEWHESLNESDMSEVTTNLTERAFVDSLVFLRIFQKEYATALEEVIAYFKVKLDDVEESSEETYLKKLLNQAISVCDAEPSLWLLLCTTLITLSKSSNAKLVNSFIHDCFHHIAHNEGAFLDIFNRILDKTEKSELFTTMANLRGILQEVFVSYSYESEMLTISRAMLNKLIFDSMDILKMDKLRGWNIMSRGCSSCGKVMWGDLDEDHYNAWLARRKAVLLDSRETEVLSESNNIGNDLIEIEQEPVNLHQEQHELEENDEENEENTLQKDLPTGSEHNPKDLLDSLDKFHHLQLIFFKCGHGYHSTCLDNLGGLRNKLCVICAL